MAFMRTDPYKLVVASLPQAFVIDANLKTVHTFDNSDNLLPGPLNPILNVFVHPKSKQIISTDADKIYVRNADNFEMDNVLNPLPMRDQFLSNSEADRVVLDIFPGFDMLNTMVAGERILAAGFAKDGLEMYVGFGNGLMLMRRDVHG